MKRNLRVLLGVFVAALFSGQSFAAGGSAIPEMLKAYEAEGAGNFTADGVKDLWVQEHKASDGKMRSCSTCHGTDLTKSGKHAKTGKVIDPMAISVNPERFTDPKKIKKWFNRNCKWAWGRECTPQEKGNFLTYFKGL